MQRLMDTVDEPRSPRVPKRPVSARPRAALLGSVGSLKTTRAATLIFRSLRDEPGSPGIVGSLVPKRDVVALFMMQGSDRVLLRLQQQGP